MKLKGITTIFILAVFALTACTSSPDTTSDSSLEDDRPIVVVSSAIASNFVSIIAGDSVRVVSLVPNSTDTHTYEPASSDLRDLENASLVVLPDSDLNPTISQVVGLSIDPSLILDLNASSLTENDYIYRDPNNKTGRNVHTWTDPTLAAKWIKPLTQRLTAIAPDSANDITARADALTNELSNLDKTTANSLQAVPPQNRKLVVYHDAWEYFGKRYGFEVVGALQAVDFSEPSASELASMIDQIRAENVPAFFGSEVFPSDVMQALQEESGARYIPDLSDDSLPGNPGDLEHSYLVLMDRNVDLIVSGLVSN